MGCKHICGYCRIEFSGHACRHDGDESVDDHGNVILRRAQEAPYHGADVKSSDVCQFVDGVHILAAPACLANDADFGLQSLIVQAAAPAHQVCGVHPRQRPQKAGAGGGVSDAHLSDAAKVHSRRLHGVGCFESGEQALHGLFPRHGRLLGQVLRSPAQPAVYDLHRDLSFPGEHLIRIQSLGNVHRHSHIHYQKVQVEIPHLRADARDPAGEVDGLRHGDLLGCGGDAFHHHAVVCAEQCNAFLLRLVPSDVSGDARHLDGDILQLAQTSGDLRQDYLTFLCFLYRILIRFLDL